MSESLRVGLIDFDVAVRSGRRLIIESDPRFSMVLEASGSASDAELVADSLIDVLVIEQRLGQFTGIDFVNLLRKLTPESKLVANTIITSPFYQDQLRLEVLAAGCFDLVPLESGPEALLNAIDLAGKGISALSPKELSKLISDTENQKFADFEFKQLVDGLPQSVRNILDELKRDWLTLINGKEFEWDLENQAKLRHLLSLSSMPELVIRMHRSGMFDEVTA